MPSGPTENIDHFNGIGWGKFVYVLIYHSRRVVLVCDMRGKLGAQRSPQNSSKRQGYNTNINKLQMRICSFSN